MRSKLVLYHYKIKDVFIHNFWLKLVVLFNEARTSTLFYSVMDCVVCKEPYDEEARCPRSLPCGHSVCTLCITILFTEKPKCCPQCRQTFSAASVQKLPKNFSVLHILTEGQPQRNVHAPGTMCETHNEEYVCMDLTCNMLVCMECITFSGAHVNHKYVKLKEVSDCNRVALTDKHTIWAARVTELRNAERVVHLHITALELNERISVKNIDKFIDDTIVQIRAHGDKLFTHLAMTYNSRRTLLSDQKNAIKTAASALSYACHTAHKCMRTDLDVILNHANVTEQGDKAHEMEVVLAPVANANIILKFTKHPMGAPFILQKDLSAMTVNTLILESDGLFGGLEGLRDIAGMDEKLIEPMVNTMVKTMSCQLLDENLQKYYCAMLAEIAEHASYSIIHAGGINAVCNAMHHHLLCADVQEYGCFALQNLSELSTASDQCIHAVFHAMTTHANSTPVQQHACAALANIYSVRQIPHNMQCIVVTTMDNHNKSADVQKYGCRIFLNMVRLYNKENEMDKPQSEKFVLAAGCVRVVIASIRRHISDGILALDALASKMAADIMSEFVSSDGVSTMIDTFTTQHLASHINSMDEENWIPTMRVLKYMANYINLQNNNRYVVACMREFSTNISIQENGCAVIASIIVKWKYAKADAEFDDVVTKAMATYPSNIIIMQHGTIITNLIHVRKMRSRVSESEHSESEESEGSMRSTSGPLRASSSEE